MGAKGPLDRYLEGYKFCGGEGLLQNEENLDLEVSIIVAAIKGKGILVKGPGPKTKSVRHLNPHR